MRGKDVVVLGVEKKSVLQLQDPRTVRKVVMLDDHICLAFAGTPLVFLLWPCFGLILMNLFNLSITFDSIGSMPDPISSV